MKAQLRELLDYYGKDYELDVVCEELAELIQAITKHKRGLSNTDNIIEETAHVLIVIDHLKMIYGFNEGDIQREIDKKIEKLKDYKTLYPRS